MKKNNRPPYPALSKPQSPAAGLARGYIAATALAGATILAYANSFGGPFIFDDTKSILENPSIRSLWPLTGPLSPPTNLGTGGRPLANLSFALNYSLGGFSPIGYHLVNLLIHVTAALTLFGLLRRAFAVLFPSARVDPLLPALGGALLWALHPLQTSSVTYLSERTEALMGLCYLFTFYAFLRGATTANRRRWLIASVAACWLGTACKEVIATAPLLILLFDAAFISGSLSAAWRARHAYYLSLAASWLLLAALLPGLSHRGAGLSLGVSPFAYALTESRAIWIYLRFIVAPYPLVLDYNASILSFAQAWPYALALLTLLATVAFLWRRHRPSAFAATAFFILLAPTSSIIPIAIQPISENRLYLPLAALTALIAYGIFRLRPITLAWAALAFTVVPLGLATAARNDDYRSAVAVWTDTVRHAPDNARAHYNLGTALLARPDQADATAAAGELSRAADLSPTDAEIRFNWGLALARTGNTAGAAAQYREALRLRPGFESARTNLGILLASTGNADDALVQLSAAVQLQPRSAPAHFNYANALLQAGHTDEALGHFATACQLAPDNTVFRQRWADVEYHLGNQYAQSADWPNAIAHYQAAIGANPNFANAHANLGSALATSGRLPEAAVEFETAARLDPSDADIRRNLMAIRQVLSQAK